MAKRGNPQLEEYRRKRDFTVTREPSPEAPAHKATGAQPLFMIHKHDATRLHYDLRLEMDGVLASWAIPKGPSYDPAVKRLAMQTEDHPLEYGNFEGRIPDGEYGAGDSLIWERGTYDTVPPGQASEQRERGRMTLELRGEKLKGRWHLVRTRPTQSGKSQWLFFKAHDEAANPDYDVVAERPESVVSGRRVTRGPERKHVLRAAHPLPDALLKKVWPPMRALLSEPDRAPPDQYFYEVKYDGYRGLAAISGGKVTFVTRNGLDLSGRFPEIARALARIQVGEAVLDGEVVALDRKGTTRFELLMSGAEERYAVFDLLWLDGEDLRPRPVEDRRELLQSLLSNVPPPLELAELVKADSEEEALAEARRRGLEGVVAKRRGSPYLSGHRGSEWLKLKVNASQELAIAGYLPISSGEKAIGALILAFYENGAFHYAGKVGTGYTAKLRRELKKLLDPDRADEPQVKDAPRMRDAVWVKPRYVAQVAFTEWTQDARLRHPAFQGLRMDKKPEECTRECPAALAKTRAKAKAGIKADTGARHAPRRLAARTAAVEAAPRTGKKKRKTSPSPTRSASSTRKTGTRRRTSSRTTGRSRR